MDNARVFTGYNSVFATRLRDKMAGNKTTQQVLANYVEVKRQTISQYMDGSIQPNIEKLYKIADFFKVSTDYLIGNNDVESSNIDNIAINKRLGLSDEAIKIISTFPNNHDVENKRRILKVLNAILSNYTFYDVCSLLYAHFEEINKEKEPHYIDYVVLEEYEKKIDEVSKGAMVVMLRKNLNDLRLFKAKSGLDKIINEIEKEVIEDGVNNG